MVIHATSGMTIEENVAYEIKGHCFMVEEGSERKNSFVRNLGINARPGEGRFPMTPSGFHGAFAWLQMVLKFVKTCHRLCCMTP